MAKKRDLISALPFGADLEIRGPPENKLFQLDHIYNRNEYPTVLALADEWSIVDESEATSYLPEPNTRKITLGIKEQQTVELPVGATLNLYKHIQSKRGFVLNLGCSVLGLDFAPKRPEVDSSPHTQYLATSGFRGAEGEHHLYNEVYPEGTYKNSIMIWRCELSIGNTETDPVLDLCLLHDYGPIKELKWCPYGAYDESSEEGWPKLGLLAIVCSDNSVRVLVVPHPRAVRESIGEMDSSKAVYMKISKARQTFQLNNMIPMTTNWGGSDKLTCGYTNGQVVNWDIKRALNTEMEERNTVPEKHMLSIAYMHDSCVRSIAWHGLENPVNCATSGNDGRLLIWDYRDPQVPMLLLRNRMVIYDMAWPGFSSRIATMDGDNLLRSVVTDEGPQGENTIVGPKAAVNLAPTQALAGSELHPFMIIGNMEGWCKFTNNHLIRRKTETDNQNVAYKLNYDSKTSIFRYIDGIPPMTLEQVKKENPALIFVNSPASIRKCTWCPNRVSAAWGASAGPAGLCRIEFLGRGSTWT